MKIYPLISISNGKVVKTKLTALGSETTYEITPMQAAKEYSAAGAQAIHILDVDGARTASAANFDIIRDIIEETGMFVQVGGGIREQTTIERYMDIGVGSIILGTVAINNLPFLRDMASYYKEKITVGIDAKGGNIMIDGWTTDTHINAEQHCNRLGFVGVKRVVYTEIEHDGVLSGIDIDLYTRLVKNSTVDIVASGGIGTLDDIIALKNAGVAGAVVGKALYSGVLDLKDILAAAR